MYGDDSALRAALERAPGPLVESRYIEGTKWCRYCDAVLPMNGPLVHDVSCWELIRRRVLDGGMPDAQ